VGLDNLNTLPPAAFYEAFSPQQARYLTKKNGVSLHVRA